MRSIEYFPVRSIIWVWGTFLLALFVFALMYFTLGWPALYILETIQGSYDFNDVANNVLELFKLTFAWSGVIFLFGMLIWAITNSKKRDVVTYEM